MKEVFGYGAFVLSFLGMLMLVCGLILDMFPPARGAAYVTNDFWKFMAVAGVLGLLGLAMVGLAIATKGESSK